MAHKVDYTELEQRFVTSEVSLRELARDVGISNSTISDQARKRGWLARRDQYRSELADRQIKKTAEAVAEHTTRIKQQSLVVLEGMLVRLAEQLADRENPMILSEKSIDSVVRNTLILGGEATERSESKVLGLHVNTTVPAELFAELEQLARRRLTA